MDRARFDSAVASCFIYTRLDTCKSTVLLLAAHWRSRYWRISCAGESGCFLRDLPPPAPSVHSLTRATCGAIVILLGCVLLDTRATSYLGPVFTGSPWATRIDVPNLFEHWPQRPTSKKPRVV